MATAIQYTLPGVPSIFYGDEVGLQGFKDPFVGNACHGIALMIPFLNGLSN